MEQMFLEKPISYVDSSRKQTPTVNDELQTDWNKEPRATIGETFVQLRPERATSFTA
jgi:hypothetical protein